MKKYLLIVMLILTIEGDLFPQAKTRRLPSIINHPSMNLFAPYMSFDGNALLFVCDDGEDQALTVSYTSRETDWAKPVVLPKHVNHRLVYLPGFALSADGKRLYFTAAKSPVVGGYDIMTSELKGTTWSEPQNLAVPINSKTNEGSPSFTTDGNNIYFMRCDKMDQNSASGCKIFSSKKKPNGQWEEPRELPPNINTGNSQTPRIMADGETLIFSSDKLGNGKGGMDLYVTRFKNGTWTDPVPMDFINTEKNDQFISVAALGRYILKDAPGARKTSELVEYLIPNELRPRGVMKVEGTVKDSFNATIPSYISVTDLSTGKRAYTGRPNADGSYMFYLMEGTAYEMSVDPEQSNVSFFSRLFDLNSDKIPQKERVNVILKKPEAGDEFLMEMIAFRAQSSQLEPSSEPEIKRLIRLAKSNPQFLFEIEVTMNGYMEDSVSTNPELTEVRIDTLKTQVAPIDSLTEANPKDSIRIKTIYHNDRTLKQAQSILDYIVKQGGDANSFSLKGTAIPVSTPDGRRLSIKVLARAKA